jgi:hypothetical protein
MANVLYEFNDFPRERELVGKLLIAYGELEFAIMGCLRAVLDDDADTATRILFRVRGEDARIRVADAIVRPAYQKLGLGPKWACAYGAARTCKNIRNQYAHCHWQVWEDTLYFMNLDAEAQAAEGPLRVTMIPLSLHLLEDQVKYFEYALDWFYYLSSEYQKRAGRISIHNELEPKSIPAPPLHSLPKTASPSHQDKESGS